MNAEQLNKAIRRADGMTREELLELVRECAKHLDFRQRTIEEMAHAVVSIHMRHHGKLPRETGLTSAPQSVE